MFFSFSSQRQHVESSWMPVWLTESSISACLLDLDDTALWNALSPSHLAEALKQRFREYGAFASIVSEGVSSTWVDDFLDEEASSIFEFIAHTKLLPGSEIEKRLNPDSNQLMECLQSSSTFSACIKERGKQAKHWFRDYENVDRQDEGT